VSKKVLIITYYWPPAGGGGVQRWVKFVKYMRTFGWEPIVLTVENGEYPVIDQSMGKELPDDIQVIKAPIIEPYTWYRALTGKKKDSKIDPNFLSQGKKLSVKDRIAVWIRGNFFIPDARVLWVGPATKVISSYLQNHHVDAVISTGPPHTCHLIAKKIKQKYQLPWIVDYRDPWTQIDFFEDLGLTQWARNRHIQMEKWILDHCDTIITVGKTMATDLEVITSNRHRVVITNGFDDADRPVRQAILDEEFSITYIGTMNDSRNPIILWEILAMLKEENHEITKHLKVKLVGKPEPVVKHSISKYGVEEFVDFCGYVAHEEAIRFQNSARILLLMINNTSNNKSILTGKIFEYMASGRPILCIGPKDGDAADILLNSGYSSIYDYQDKVGIKSFLIEQYQEFKLGNSSNSIPDKERINQYSRKSLTGKLVNVLNQIVTKNQK
jgi:glycosyltransferase involved in cell wall biosynthesis